MTAEFSPHFLIPPSLTALLKATAFILELHAENINVSNIRENKNNVVHFEIVEPYAKWGNKFLRIC
jgi:hypothetical protein